MSVKVNDNSKIAMSAFEKQMQNGLNAIGVAAEEYAKRGCPVDTGRARASITYATSTESKNTETPHEEGDDTPKATPEKTAVYIGGNVEYLAKIETMDMPHKTGKAHFLRDAAAQHGNEYKELMKKALET